MTRFGRFLYLDWAQAYLISHDRSFQGGWENVTAQHDGYKKLGVIHQRGVTGFANGGWIVEDMLFPVDDSKKLQLQEFRFSLHWLLPDWKWEIENDKHGNAFLFRQLSPYGWFSLKMEVYSNSPGAALDAVNLHVFRAGKLLYGEGREEPILGWYSPTYNYKESAISLVLDFRGRVPVTISSEWTFPED